MSSASWRCRVRALSAQRTEPDSSRDGRSYYRQDPGRRPPSYGQQRPHAAGGRQLHLQEFQLFCVARRSVGGCRGIGFVHRNPHCAPTACPSSPRLHRRRQNAPGQEESLAPRSKRWRRAVAAPTTQAVFSQCSLASIPLLPFPPHLFARLRARSALCPCTFANFRGSATARSAPVASSSTSTRNRLDSARAAPPSPTT